MRTLEFIILTSFMYNTQQCQLYLSCCALHLQYYALSYISYNWKFAPFDCLYLISPHHHQPLNSLFLRLNLFIHSVSSCYTTLLFNISIQELPLPQVQLRYVIIQRHCTGTMFPTLSSSYLWLSYFAMRDLHLLISLTHFFLPSIPLPSGNYLFSPYIALFLFCYVCSFVLIFRFQT